MDELIETGRHGQAKTPVFRTKQEEAWELGGEIVDQGLGHPCMQVVSNACQDVLLALAEIQRQSAGLKKIGVGRTEDPTLIIARLVPALRNLSEEASFIADQLQERLKRG